MYPTTDTNHNYQLKVIYSSAANSSTPVRVIENNYYIQDIRDVLSRISNQVLLSGRVQWRTAIQQTFGRGGSKLLDVPNVLGDIIGSAARLYAFDNIENSGMSNGTGNSRFTRFGPEVSGRDFIDVACRWLLAAVVS